MVLIQLWINTTRKVLKYRMREIYISRDETYTKIYLIEDMQIVEKHKEEIKNPMIEGNIYVGKVQNVLPGMQAAFVRIGNTKNAFVHLKDLLPKEDVTKPVEKSSQNDIRKVIKPRRPNISSSNAWWKL